MTCDHIWEPIGVGIVTGTAWASWSPKRVAYVSVDEKCSKCGRVQASTNLNLPAPDESGGSTTREGE